MSSRKSELQILDDEFGGGWDFEAELAATNNPWDEGAETDEEYKRHQKDMLRQDPYLQQLDEIETRRRGIHFEMVDIDLIS